jgi:hypothetical protein
VGGFVGKNASGAWSLIEPMTVGLGAQNARQDRVQERGLDRDQRHHQTEAE